MSEPSTGLVVIQAVVRVVGACVVDFVDQCAHGDQFVDLGLLFSPAGSWPPLLRACASDSGRSGQAKCARGVQNGKRAPLCPTALSSLSSA